MAERRQKVELQAQQRAERLREQLRKKRLDAYETEKKKVRLDCELIFSIGTKLLPERRLLDVFCGLLG